MDQGKWYAVGMFDPFEKRDGIRSDFERVGKDIAKVIDFEVKRTNKSSQ